MSKRKNNNSGCCGCFAGCFGCFFMLIVTIVVLCGFLYVFIQRNAPKPPQVNFTPDPVAANQFENAVSNASSQAARTGRFDVTVTEAQASSWLNLEAQSIANGDIPLENMQARFQNGESSVYGEVDAFGITNLGVELGISYVVTNGELQVDVSTVDFAGVGLPNSFKEQLSDQVQNLIDSELSDISDSYYVESISSRDGVLTVRGRVG